MNICYNKINICIMFTFFRGCIFYFLMILGSFMYVTIYQFIEIVFGSKLYILTQLTFLFANYYFLMSGLSGLNIWISGDLDKIKNKIKKKDKQYIAISNHRSKLDGPLLQALLVENFNDIFVSVAINYIKTIPLMGSMANNLRSLFVMSSKENINKNIDILKNGAKRCKEDQLNILIFPEGSVMTPKLREISDDYSKKNDLPLLQNLMLPRITGFKVLQDTDIFDSEILNATIFYSDPELINNESHDFKDLFTKFPKNVYINFDWKSIKADELIQEWVIKDKSITEHNEKILKNNVKLYKSNKIKNVINVMMLFVFYFMFYNYNIFRYSTILITFISWIKTMMI